jgi:hypothetical protein
MQRLIPSLVLLLFLFSCASRKAGWESQKTEQVQKAVKGNEQKILAEARENWSKRENKLNLEKSIALYTQLLELQTDQLDTLIRLAQAHYFYADAHLSDKEEKKKFWEEGTSFGERAMATNPEFKKAMLAGGNVEDHLQVLSKKQVGAIYWSATNLGKWAKNSGIATMLKYKSRIKKMIERVQELDRSYFHYAADRYWGVYYAVAPSFAGGDIKKSIKHFKQSYKKSPNYLGTLVLNAEFYATKSGDQTLFTSLLKQVLSTSLDPKSPLYPDNKLQQRRAKELLALSDELF